MRSRHFVMGTVLSLAAVMATGEVRAEAFGSMFYTGSGQAGNVTASTWIGYRFTAAESFTGVDRVHFQLQGVTGASNLPVEVYQDDGSGNPGTLLATATVASPTAGINIGSLNSTLSLSAGTVYHVIVKNPTSGSVSVRQLTSSSVGYNPFDGSADAYAGRILTTNSGSSWASANTVGLYAGLSSSGSHKAAGQPYTGTSSAPGASDGGRVGGTQWRGEEFVYTKPTGKVDSITVRLIVPAGTPADDLRVHLLDSSNNSLFSGTLVAAATFAAAVTDNFTINITNNQPTLQNGQTYRLVLDSPNSAVGAYLVLGNVVDGSATAPAGDLMSRTFGGSSAYYIRGTAASAGATPTTWLNYDTTYGSGYDAFDAVFQLEMTIPEPTAMGAMSVTSLMLLGRRRGR